MLELRKIKMRPKTGYIKIQVRQLGDLIAETKEVKVEINSIHDILAVEMALNEVSDYKFQVVGIPEIKRNISELT